MQAGNSTAAVATVSKVQDPAKNGKRITDWIKSIGDLQKVHRSQQASLLCDAVLAVCFAMLACCLAARQTAQCEVDFDKETRLMAKEKVN